MFTLLTPRRLSIKQSIFHPHSDYREDNDWGNGNGDGATNGGEETPLEERSGILLGFRTTW